VTVDDEHEDIHRGLHFATNRAPLVIVTGGLGPTPNDITRETLAEFTGTPLREDEQALADMEKRLNQTRDQLRPNLRRQTQVPVRGGHLKNPNGTAVGLIYDAGGPVIAALPGPPRELQPMVKNELVPFLRQRFGVRLFGASLTLRFVGAGQSLIDQTIKEHVTIAPDVITTSLFEGSRVDFSFSLPGHTAEDQARLRRLAEVIREHLGDYMYGEGDVSLEAVVIHGLRTRQASLVLAEVGSGGSLAAALHAAEGASNAVTGAFAAPTELALSRLLQVPHERAASWTTGEEAASALAAAAADSTHSQWAVAVSAPRTDPKGARNVWVAIRSPGPAATVVPLSLRDSGELARAGLSTQVLDRLRRLLRNP
jgi:nicotinamide-nucleotide amidase